MSDAPANRLIDETSPYLLQHAYNPVDWYPWGDEALALARDQDRPIFLSIGYSACHWCHVMERECFEDPEIAAVMNELFVNIKVDREERPDVDEIYMAAVQVMTGSGGWPLSMFLTPELHPFYGGTYFPPQDRWGRPGFPTILRRVADVYAKQKDRISQEAHRMTEVLAQHTGLPGAGGPEAPAPDAALPGDLLDRALERRGRAYDPLHGGFGSAPKFPPHFVLEALTRALWGAPHAARQDMLVNTLERMARGGMYDQLGGGFARYSTDERWLVPHFEKMLYDNAQLVPSYLAAATLTGRDEFRRVARETLDWCLREMLDEAGGIHSSQDADSEGVEGKFFVWTPDEVAEALDDPEDARVACAYWDVTARGNWHEMPERSVLHVEKPPRDLAKVLGLPEAEVEERLARARTQLFEARRQRVAPATDTKVLTSWNGMMIRALAHGARALDEPRYREAAERAATFCWTTLRGEGGLLRTYREGKAHLNAYLEDHANLAHGLVELFVTTGELRWLEAAATLCDEMIERFWDEEEGGFFFTSHDHEQLIVRTRAPMDNATPSGNSVAARVLLRLAQLLDRPAWREKAEATLRAFLPGMQRLPEGYFNMVVAADQASRPPCEVVLIGPAGDPDLDRVEARLRERAHPDVWVLRADPAAADHDARLEALPLLRGKPTLDGAAAVYVCAAGSCQAPWPATEVDDERLAEAVPGAWEG